MPSDFLEFATIDDPLRQPAIEPGWKLAVIDDDEVVHEGTRFALRHFVLEGYGLEIVGARSAEEGFELLKAHPDTAVVLLDVVMESDDAGLKLAKRIREELKNELIRIILRTGQPGQAPERQVVVDYDINDYKAKTELTADKLFTTLTTALRGFDQLKRLDDTRIGLEMIVGASASLFDDRSLQTLAHGVLIQISALLEIETDGILIMRETNGADPHVLASLGKFESTDCMPFDRSRLFAHAASAGKPFRHDGLVCLFVKTGSGAEILVALATADDLSETQASLVSVFSAKLAIAFDNARLYDELRLANEELEARVAERTLELAGANERLRAQRALLKRVNAFKNEILGTIAHDLKNPIAVVLGRSEMLTSLTETIETEMRERFAKQLDHIRASAERMTRIVERSIADALADALDITIERRSVDLAAITETTAELSRAIADRKGQSLAISIAERLMIEGDPDRLAEAIDNLVSNAMKYAPPGGDIRIEAVRSNGNARVTVADSGPGLNAQDTLRLFGRFQRLSAQPTGGESSTGLGLSIVSKIVELHDGEIVVEEKGALGGASFSILLPLRES
ncbi:DUF3369 domain-containing protein [Jiella sp. MQZ9-1]|uniref:histidine kinase n=1 Tax=Jiella flava TaxID=2816857 RepID=A0A939G1Y9_9HYPH|nr:DUF3369 domain-containing protein [Jiella flava]MBO0663692.1 DUF3369 domain-containing protein [Jiella flava]MCD2472265.1 DUF3369 domain-containing protein [Jiella flava]